MGGSTPGVDDAAVSWLPHRHQLPAPVSARRRPTPVFPAPRSPPDVAGAPVDGRTETRGDRVTAAMRRAVALSAAGGEVTHPNPNVGAVVLDASGEVVGEGRHE